MRCPAAPPRESVCQARLGVAFFSAIAFGAEGFPAFTGDLGLPLDALAVFDLGARSFALPRVMAGMGSLSLTAFTALEAVLTVDAETNVFPSAARLPMMVPAIAPATAPTGPAIMPPAIAPAIPPAVCFEIGRLSVEPGEEVFV